MQSIAQTLVDVARFLKLDVFLGVVGTGGAIVALIAVLFVLVEIANGMKPARYRSRWFVNDILYSIFYRGGFWAVLLSALLTGVFDGHLSFLRSELLSDLPLLPAMLVFWIGGDLAVYWIHRLQHAVPFLWAFHRIHHAETEMSPLSLSRHHPIDELMIVLSWYVPLVFVLGVPTQAWVPWWVAMQVVEALQHAQLPWRFGPFYRFVVSPVFHSVHHSTNPAEHDKNFALHFSFWDYLFGTASTADSRPDAYGVDGPAIAESIPVQLVEPFKYIFIRGYRENSESGVRNESAST